MFAEGADEDGCRFFVYGIDDAVFGVDATGPVTGEVADKLLGFAFASIGSFKYFQQ